MANRKQSTELEGYQYFAFISYSHKDAKWGKLIYRKLYYYHLPSTAQEEYGGDPRIRPICKDNMTLPPGPLRDGLRGKLESSKYLIVICSPHSAHPNLRKEHWVNDEVKHFIERGGKDRIIPVIVDGVPNSDDPAKECFCPALREQGILGVDLTKETIAKGLSFIVAKLLGLDTQILWDLDREDAKRKRWLRFGLFLPVLLLSALGGLFAWDSTRTVEKYYADYVDSYGLPEGIFELQPEVMRKRNCHYRFIYQGFRFGKSIHADSSGGNWFSWLGCERILRRVVQANSAGRPMSRDNQEVCHRPVLQEFKYDEQEGGFLREITCSYKGDLFGDVRIRQLYSNRFYKDGVETNGLVKFVGRDDSMPMFQQASHALMDYDGKSTSIAQYQIGREKGRTRAILFMNANGEPTMDADGVSGEFYVLDEETGRIEEIWNKSWSDREDSAVESSSTWWKVKNWWQDTQWVKKANRKNGHCSKVSGNEVLI